jgi:D-inositol-3-phosphate glycosyltransferase
MAKILWYGDACSNTGFGRVTHSVLEHLTKEHEVCVLGINYTGDPHEHPYKIYPACAGGSQDRFGVSRIPEILHKERPDVVICLNDIWIVNQFWERCQFLKDDLKFKFIAYFPVDSERYYPDMLQNMPFWDLAITFTINCAHRILSHKINIPRLGVLPHGVDSDRFYPTSKEEARQELGLPLDKFIVFNGNRNQPRKRIDLTIQAFAEFAIDKPDTMLYLHMGAKDLGWDVMPLFQREMTKRGLDDKHRLILTSSNMNYMDAPPDSLLNTIYNACDVGLNTADGEGWGLVSFENASCRKPQVVPNHTACKDIWEGAAQLADIATWVVDKDLGVERGLVDVSHTAQLLTELYEDKSIYAEVADACYAVTQRLSTGGNLSLWDSLKLSLIFLLDSCKQHIVFSTLTATFFSQFDGKSEVSLPSTDKPKSSEGSSPGS